MTTDPIPATVSVSDPITQSPSKSPRNQRSPIRPLSPSTLDTTARPESPSKMEMADLAPSVAAESGSFAQASTVVPITKSIQSPLKISGSPVAPGLGGIVPDQDLIMTESGPQTELLPESEHKPQPESEPTEMATSPTDQDMSSSITTIDKTPVKRGRASTNGTTSTRKRSVGGAGVSSVSRKSIAASSLVRSVSFSVGDIVFAHVKGHPWWPARILEEKDVPEKFLRERRTSKERCIMFYNSDQYGFLGDEYLVPFSPNVVALASNAAVKKAIKEAEDNPNVIFDRIENIKKMSTEDEIEYDDDEEYDGDRRTSSNKSRKSSVHKSPKSIKRRALDEEDNHTSKRSKTEGTTTTSNRTSKRKAGIEATIPYEGPNDMLMRWRHVLQKTFIKDKSIGDKPRISPETIHTVDFDNIKIVFDEFYEYMMGPTYNADDVAKTKLHKVVRLIAASSAMSDPDPLLLEYNVPAQITRLMDALRYRSEGVVGATHTTEATENVEPDH